MKIQYIAVIFIVIILPIAMTMSFYIGSQIDTINLQIEYNTKLENCTYDCMRAFQINTANNRYSSVANSKIRDIEAAASTFYESLATNQDMRIEDISEFVPALVFTLYDGYYIYSKYENVYGGKNITIGKPQINAETLKGEEYENEGLKPYIYYSCRFKKGQKDFVVNFTLDNAITIYGDLGEGYKTYSGYLINPNNVQGTNNLNMSNPLSWRLTYSNNSSTTSDDVEIKPELLTEHLLFANGDQNDYDYIVYNGQKIYYDREQDKYFFYQNYEKTYLTVSSGNRNINEYLDARKSGGHLYSTSSIEYYKTAKEFSEKIMNLTRNISQVDAKDVNGNAIKFTVDTGNDEIFVPDENNDPLLSGSTFNEIRMQVIRKSIETNLTTAIAQYSDFNDTFYEFRLPVMSEVDWAKITSKVSIISFLQGIPIGHKYFNNYCVITNDNNEETVNKENIYIITENASGQREYHLPGCMELAKPESDTKLKIVDVAYNNLNFVRQTVRISEGNYLYFYPQTRMNGNSIKTITACYYCIVNAGAVHTADEIIAGKTVEKNSNWEDVIKADVTKVSNIDKRLKEIREYYIRALGRERYDLYRFNIDTFTT